MVNFNELANKRMDEIERPANIPVGTYRAQVKKAAAISNSNDGKWEIVDFPLQLVEAIDGVEPEDLAAYGGLGNQSVVNRKFMFNTEDEAAQKRTLFDMKRFLVEHLKCGTEEMSLKECINGAMGAQCLVFVKWTPDKNDPEIQYANAAKTAPLD